MIKTRFWLIGTVAIALLLRLGLQDVAAAEKIPIIYSTDLFHPHDDPDDHFDLATLFALDEFEILGIIVEHADEQTRRPGGIPVRQMMHISGRTVPCVVGLNPPLRTPDDKALEQPEACQAGVRLILDSLRAADRKVTIFTTGSMRDVAAAWNRDPDLLRSKVGRLYMNIGNASGTASEYNVDLDREAYVRILRSGLPVYWCPCFGPPYGTYWKFHQAEVLETAPAPLQNFFVYALTAGREWNATPRPSTDNPLDFLQAKVDPEARRAVWNLDRNMWCTAPFFHAAGRQIVQVADGEWAARRAVAGDERVVQLYDFVPGVLTIGEVGMTTFAETPNDRSANTLRSFKVLDPERYGPILASCLRSLFRASTSEKGSSVAR